jgi:hypothetical protein
MRADKPSRPVARNIIKNSLVRVSLTTLTIELLHVLFTHHFGRLLPGFHCSLIKEGTFLISHDTDQSEQVDEICAHRIDEIGVSDPVLPPTLPTFHVCLLSDIQVTNYIAPLRLNNISSSGSTTSLHKLYFPGTTSMIWHQSQTLYKHISTTSNQGMPDFVCLTSLPYTHLVQHQKRLWKWLVEAASCRCFLSEA